MSAGNLNNSIMLYNNHTKKILSDIFIYRIIERQCFYTTVTFIVLKIDWENKHEFYNVCNDFTSCQLTNDDCNGYCYTQEKFESSTKEFLSTQIGTISVK